MFHYPWTQIRIFSFKTTIQPSNVNYIVHLLPSNPKTLKQFSSVAQLCPTLQPHGLQHARLPCPSPTPRACSNSCTLSQWCHPAISSSVVPFSSCLLSFPASGSFPMSQFFASGGQSIGVSASALVLSINFQGWSPLGWIGWISQLSKGLSRVFSSTTVHIVAYCPNNALSRRKKIHADKQSTLRWAISLVSFNLSWSFSVSLTFKSPDTWKL